MSPKKNSRLVAAEIVFQWLDKQRFPDRSLARLKQDHAFVLEVVNGVVRNRNIFLWLESQWLRNEPQLFYRAVLWVGLYQLLFMDNVEEYAAISETVNAAKAHSGGKGADKMINAVLRRAQREREQVLSALAGQPAHIRLSHPRMLLDRWSREYGEEEAIRLAEWDNLPPETVLRIEQSAIDAETFVDRLKEAGIEPRLHPYSAEEIFLVLPRGIAANKVPGYAEGWFTIQDPATSIAVDLLAPRPGESVLDACAAPGGKTVMMAGRMNGKGELVAMDIHDDRIAVLKENLGRLGMDWVELVQGDARDPVGVLGERKFDAILLDVPCLNTGVLRRRVDARWRVDEQRIGTITQLQDEILTACSVLLKPRGRIVYSTCSLEPEENEDLAGAWAGRHPDFRLIKTGKAFPPESGTDGAFAALFRRK
ncbi:MAG TPA: 16S rRNA (cytosine(967)-C(5))-methyltransferase RsmB [Pontiella sp.]